jgi:hypothetical protein
MTSRSVSQVANICTWKLSCALRLDVGPSAAITGGNLLQVCCVELVHKARVLGHQLVNGSRRRLTLQPAARPNCCLQQVHPGGHRWWRHGLDAVGNAYQEPAQG